MNAYFIQSKRPTSPSKASVAKIQRGVSDFHAACFWDDCGGDTFALLARVQKNIVIARLDTPWTSQPLYWIASLRSQ